MTKLEQIYQKCKHDKIPLMRQNTINYLIDFLKDKKNITICEIGTGYGYSAYQLSCLDGVEKIVSIEKDHQRHTISKSFLQNESKIELINECAFVYQPDQMFDLIILDGPKNKQQLLWQKYNCYLKLNGYFFVDNLNLFNHLIISTKRQVKLAQKVANFKQWLKQLDDQYWTKKFLEIDDGFGLFQKIKVN